MTVSFENQKDYDAFLTSPLDVREHDKESLKCSVVVDDEQINDFINAVSGKRIKSFDEHSVTLEEYFMHYYKTDKKFGGMSYA